MVPTVALLLALAPPAVLSHQQHVPTPRLRLVDQARVHARALPAAASASQTGAATAAKMQIRQDSKWDGALAGAIIGGVGGLLVGWAGSYYDADVKATTLGGAGLGAVVGLIIDLARK